MLKAGGEGHGPGGEGPGTESSGESGASGSEESSGANQLAPDETFDMVRGGARLVLSYAAASNSFEGTVENTTNSVLTRVRIEVHLSNGTELATTPVDMAPGQVLPVNLPSTQAAFTGWVAHAEVGGGEGGQSGSEHRGGGESGGGAWAPVEGPWRTRRWWRRARLRRRGPGRRLESARDGRRDVSISTSGEIIALGVSGGWTRASHTDDASSDSSIEAW